MMDRIFNLDNPVMRFLGRAFDMMMLNILFIVCSLPIFTIGASLSALHYSCLKMKDENEGYVFRNFFRSFKMNFKQGTGMWLIMLALGLLLFMENRMAAQITNASVRPIRIMIYVAASLWYMALCWMFALQSRFVNNVGQTIKNAVLLTFAKAPRSIGMLGILALELIFVARSSGLVQSYAILYLLMFGFSVQVLINTQLQYPVIKELMPNDEDDKPAADSQFTVDEEADVSALGYTPLPKDEKKPGADTPPHREIKQSL